MVIIDLRDIEKNMEKLGKRHSDGLTDQLNKENEILGR